MPDFPYIPPQVHIMNMAIRMVDIDKVDPDYFELARAYLNDEVHPIRVMKILGEALPIAAAIKVVRSVQ